MIIAMYCKTDGSNETYMFLECDTTPERFMETLKYQLRAELLDVFEWQFKVLDGEDNSTTEVIKLFKTLRNDIYNEYKEDC